MKKIIMTIVRWIKGEMYLIEQGSSNALSSFQTTLDNLDELEARIDAEAAKKQAKVEKLAANVATLSATKEKNARIANKIRSFLND